MRPSRGRLAGVPCLVLGDIVTVRGMLLFMGVPGNPSATNADGSPTRTQNLNLSPSSKTLGLPVLRIRPKVEFVTVATGPPRFV